MATFGESEGDQAHLSFLTFTVGALSKGQKHELRIAFGSIGFALPHIDTERKVYEITGFLYEIDGKKLKMVVPSVLPVTVTHYMPSHVRKGDAALKITDSVGYDLDELLEDPESAPTR